MKKKEVVMPTYEYECKSCGYSFDVFQSMSDEPLTSCPQCGKELRRLINGGSGIIFKGSGFYVTDRKSGESAKAGSSAKPAESAAKPADSAAKSADSSSAKAESGNRQAKQAAG
jgi:putative FmdB family regulatory protein